MSEPDPRARIAAAFALRLTRHQDSLAVAEAMVVPGADLALAGSRWTTVLRRSPRDDGGLALDVAATCAAGTLAGAALSARFELPWSRDAHLCIPGAVYAGNRFPARRVPYPPMWTEADCRPGLPATITDVPRLTDGDGRSALALLAGDCTAAAIGAVLPDGTGFWLVAEGPVSLHASESPARDRLVLEVRVPGVREGSDYGMIDSARPSRDRGVDAVPGTVIALGLRLHAWSGGGIPGLMRRWPELLLAHGDPGDHRAQLPFSAAFAIQEAKYAGNWDGRRFRVGMGEAPYDDWQAGWVGGGIATLPLLLDGDATSRARARANLDWLVGPGQAPSGWFHGIIHRERPFGDGFGRPGTGDWHLVRKSADVLLFLAKQILAADGPPAWRAGLARCADAILATWRRHGELGQFVDVADGRVLVPGSAAGAIAPAGLVLAARILDRPDLLAAAAEMALADHRRWVARGLSTGGPGEILQCPDSESAFALLESAVALAEATGDAAWWERAADAACLAATWVCAADFPFPAASTFGRLGMRSRGSVWANVQNKHSAPGICTLSGDSLLRLARGGGDLRWLDLLRGIARGLPQYLSRADRPVRDLPPGWMCERVNTSDWERDWCPPGEVFRGSCWCEVSLLLTRLEVPGVYVRRDLGRCWTFDHVAARLEGDALVLANPTAFPARVRILAEDAAAATRPLPPAAVARLPQAELAAGASLRWNLRPAARGFAACPR